MFYDINTLYHLLGALLTVYSSHILISKGWNRMVMSATGVWYLEIPPSLINIMYLIPLEYKRINILNVQVRRKWKKEGYRYPRDGYSLWCHTSDINAVVIYQESNYDCFLNGYYYIRADNACLTPQNRTSIIRKGGNGNYGPQEYVPYTKLVQMIFCILASRPRNVFFGYDDNSYWCQQIRYYFKCAFEEAIALYSLENVFVCCRAILGIEQIAIEEAFKLGIQVWIMSPFDGLEKVWTSRKARENYLSIKRKAIVTDLSCGKHPVSDKQAKWMLMHSVEPTIDASNHVLAVCDINTDDEVKRAIKYSNQKDKPVTMVDLSQIQSKNIMECVQDNYVLKESVPVYITANERSLYEQQTITVPC